MWTVVYVAHSHSQAELLRSLLQQEGLMVNVRTAGPANADKRYGSFEILVPELEVEEATEILTNALQR